MTLPRLSIYRRLAIAGLIGGLTLASLPTMSQPGTGEGRPDPAVRKQKMQEHVKTRLDRMEERLKVTPQQQGAWSAYRQTAEGLLDSPVAKPEPNADAATITRFRAERAKEHAQKMSQLADATSTLQQALTPEQRKVLDEMVRRPMHGPGGDHRKGR